jgi:hypothetical protein
MGDLISKIWAMITRLFPTIDVDVSDNSVAVKVIPSRADLEKMSKKEIDALASAEYGINLDGRKTKAKMIDQLFAELDAQD